VRLNNWSQSVGRVGPVYVQRNTNSLVLIAGKRIGTNEWRLMFEAEDLCNSVATGLEERLGMKLGRGVFLGAGRGKAHFEVSGDPVAELVADEMTVGNEVGSIGDKSYPHTLGSITLPRLRDVTSYLRTVTGLPDHIDSNQRETMKKLSEIETQLGSLRGDAERPSSNRVQLTRIGSDQNNVGSQVQNDPIPSIGISSIILADQSLPQGRCPLTLARLDQYDSVVNQ
jgi:hypothetical protein